MSVLSKSIVQSVFKSFEAEKRVTAKAREGQDIAIQQAVDAMAIACDVPKVEFMKGNAKTNMARAEVKALFMGLCDAGYISKATATNYQTSFWVAFEKGVPFRRDLFATENNAKDSEGEGKGGAKASTKAGAVKSTKREDLDKTLWKAIEQARLLGLKGFAEDLADLATEQLDGFEAPKA